MLVFFLGTAQEEDFYFSDYTYATNIKSVKFHVDGLFLSLPVIDLNSGSQLALSFDDLDGGIKDYTYRIIHCDRDWSPSGLTEMEYLDGFTEERIENFQFSFKTIFDYTHYELKLPNRNISWTKSGNYLLLVFEEDYDELPVITRRFMVVEPMVKIIPDVVRPSQVGKMRTHQEIDFAVDHERLEIRVPRQEITATIIQNGHWGHAVRNIPPLFTRVNRMIFDYQDKVVFPAMKEFRYLDMRSLRFRSENISVIENYRDGTEVILFKDEKRAGKSYYSREDINGQFVIENIDQGNFDPDIASDYAYVLFSLYSPQPFEGRDVYLYGGFTDWKLYDDFKMVYNNSINGYVAKVPLKQGYYDYVYVTTPEGDPRLPPNFEDTEGNNQETENEYSIFIYYRPFGARYDRLIGAVTFNSGF